MTAGICTNLPSHCSKASSRELIPMPTPDVVCPECGSRLQPQKEAPRSNALGPILALAALALVAVVGAVFFLGSLNHKGAKGTPSGATGGFTPSAGGDYLLRLSGSNTIGSDLGPKLIEAWLGSKGATGIRSEQRTGPDGAKIPEQVISATLGGRTVKVEVKAHGSADAFKDLASGAADIGMASRPIKDEEMGQLASLGDMRGRASEHVLALDGIAVITPQANAVPRLTLAQLKSIFSSQITDWSGVGGAAGPIHLFARDDKSGTFDAFKSLVLQGGSLGSAKRYEDSAALENDVAHDPAAIGFVGMPYVKTTRAVPIGDGLAVALEPTVFTVKTESYALSRRLFLYTAAQPANPAVREFVEFALSGAGQQVVRQAQFVDLDLRQPMAAPSPEAASANCRLSERWKGDRDEYCKLRAGSRQLGTSFRFRVGSADLDNRAARDLRRVLEAVEGAADKTIVLAGFADSSGTYPANCALSRARGQRVSEAFATLGLRITDVRGYCDELPVRDNATDAGREQNRRVEIFLR
ncbi:MAG: substrate-binding domain-containing protein [Caulobacteraceae bacterium]|nr:substrate-binding domain-containing protein [Caulobacteraceae bacterium]